MAKKPSKMTPAEYRAAMIAKRKKKKDARTNASEFANLGSATGMQRETNKARNAGRSANLGTGNPMKSRGADPANLAGKGGRGTGLNLAKKSKTPDQLAAAAKTKRNITAKVTAAEKKAKPAAKSATKTAKTTSAKTWKDYSSIAAAKAAGSLYYSKGGEKKAAVTQSDLDKSGLSLRDYLNYKTGKTRKAAAKKTTAPKKGTSTYDEVKSQKGKKAAPKSSTNSKTKARDLTLRDKGGISARRNKKGPLAQARKEYPVTGPGSQSKILRKKK